jgi:hypothetical protein
MSRVDAPNSSQARPAVLASLPETAPPISSSVPKLVSSVARPPTVLPPAANNNAQRTGEGVGVFSYASAGRTAGGDSLYAGVALIKGHDKSGADIEVLSASAQVGAQNELQFGFQRVGLSGGGLTGSVEAFTLRAHMGAHNDDGSEGANIGVSATAVGLEGTVGGSTSGTFGVAAGVGFGASSGLRDQDRDGAKEYCVRVSVGPATLGLCVENPL